MKMYAGMSRIYVPLLLAQLGVIAWAPAHLLSWSYAAVLAMLVLTVAQGWRRLRLSVPHNRPLWSLLLLALAAPLGAFGLLFTDSLSNPLGTLVAFDPTFYFCLGSLLLTIAAAYNPVATLYRWAGVVDAVLACAIAALFYFTLHQVLNAPSPTPPPATFVMWMFDAMGLFVAVFATLRLVSTKRSDERRFFFVLSVFAWLELVVPGIHNRFILHSESYLPELLLGLPFVVLGFLLGRRRKVWLRSYRPSRRIRHLAESISPFVMSLALCCLAFAQLGKNPVLATSTLILAIASYAARNAIVLGQHLAFEDDLRKLKRGLQQAVVRDDLTALPNRRGFQDYLRRTLAIAQRHGETGVMAYVDLDNFKEINDRHGHDTGDAALRHVARILSENLRLSDFVARLHGDEFALVLARASAAQGAMRARRLQRLIGETPLRHGSLIIAVAASFGIAAYGRETEAADLLRRADRAMYEEKRARVKLAALGAAE